MEAGAKMIKLFPAQLWTPEALKALKAVGRFGEVELLPSGERKFAAGIYWPPPPHLPLSPPPSHFLPLPLPSSPPSPSFRLPLPRPSPPPPSLAPPT